MQKKKSRIHLRGFGSMNKERHRAIASKGGKAISKDRKHMSKIGRRGGLALSQDKKHMAEIGRKGGKSSKRKK